MSTKLFRMFILSLVTVFALALFGCTEEIVEGEVEGAVEGVEGEGAEGEGAEGAEGAEGEGAEGAEGAEGEGAEGEGAEGEGEGEGEGEAEAPSSFETPEAVFEALKSAMESEDLAGVIKCYAPEGRKTMAAGMVMAVNMAVKGKKNKDKKPAAEELMAKYEVPDMKKLKGNKKKKMKALGEAIADVDGFLVDAMKFLETTQKEKPANPYAEAELIKLKVKGEKASAKYKGAKGKPAPIKFIKVEESWFLAI